MGNTRKPKIDTFDSLVAEVKKDPYKLTLPDGETLVVPQPTGKQALKAQEMAQDGGSAEDQLRAVLGDEGLEKMEPLLMEAPADASRLLIERVMKHFGYDVGEGPSPI